MFLTKSQNKKDSSNKNFINVEDITYHHKKYMTLSKICVVRVWKEKNEEIATAGDP